MEKDTEQQTTEQFALEGKQLKIGYSQKTVIPEMNVRIPKGKITSIIGPNGCGKSTLLKGLARIIPLQGGTIFINKEDMSTLSTKQIARKMALLPQGPQTPAGLSVRELVGFGRYPYQNGLSGLTKKDREMIDWAMAQTRVEELSDHSVDQLSGGQPYRCDSRLAESFRTRLSRFRPERLPGPVVGAAAIKSDCLKTAR